MPFLSSIPFYVIVFLVATNVASLIGWEMSSSKAEANEQKVVACQAKHDAFVAQTRAQGDLAKEKAKAKEKQDAAIADETARGRANAIPVVRAYVAKRLRDSASRSAGSRALPEAGQAAGRTPRSSEDALPPTERIVADCAETTLTLVWLQHWITETQDAANE